MVVVQQRQNGLMFLDALTKYVRLCILPPPRIMTINFRDDSRMSAKKSKSSIHSVWLGGRVVRTLDLRSTGREFESWPLHCRVQTRASCQHIRTSVTKQYNLVPANGRWCLTVGLASHWPRVADISGSSPTGSRPGRRRWAHRPYALLWSMVNLEREMSTRLRCLVEHGWLYLILPHSRL